MGEFIKREIVVLCPINVCSFKKKREKNIYEKAFVLKKEKKKKKEGKIIK